MKVKRYSLIVRFKTPLLGTLPQKDVATEYITAKAGFDVPDEEETLPMALERGTTAFHKTEDGTILLYDYQIKGFIKEAGRTFNGLNDVKALRSKIEAYVFLRPRRIPLVLPEGQGLTICERPLRAMTMQGERVSLARSEQAPAGSAFSAEIHVLPGPITEDILHELLGYGEYKGIGQWRSGGKGAFEYSLERLKDGDTRDPVSIAVPSIDDVLTPNPADPIHQEPELAAA